MIRRDRGARSGPPDAQVERTAIQPPVGPRLHRLITSSPRTGIIATGVAALVMVSLAVHSLFGGEAVQAGNLPLVRPPQSGKSELLAPTVQAPSKPPKLVVPTEEFTGEAANPYAVCGLPSALNPDSPPWKDWVTLSGTRLAATTTDPGMPIYAARTPYGLAVVVANHEESKVAFSLNVKLGRGVYTAERWVFDTNGPETGGRVERLESLVLGKTGIVEKPGWLPAGHAAVYKFTNRCVDVQASFDNVRQAVRAMMGTSPSACRTIMTPLRECEGHLGSLSKGIKPEKRYDSLRYIHRALLTVNHAQALAQNLRGQGRLPQEGSERLEGALDHLQTALTDLSAGCLNLLPSLIVAPPDEAQPGVRSVTVQLANAGQQSVSLVRLGADAAGGATVAPAERATFDVLRPGETARATFTVRLPEDSSTSDLSAEIAWFASKTPARLHIKGSF